MIKINKEFPDAYISENLPLPESRKKFLRTVYGADMDTQPLCPDCGRPMYYEFDRRTGGAKLYCPRCRENNQEGH